jgi:hypothetical protein
MKKSQIEKFRQGVLSKEELFIILARKVCTSESGSSYCDLEENDKREFVEWIKNLLEEGTFFAIGGVGSIFSVGEIDSLRIWYEKCLLSQMACPPKTDQ